MKHDSVFAATRGSLNLSFPFAPPLHHFVHLRLVQAQLARHEEVPELLLRDLAVPVRVHLPHDLRRERVTTSSAQDIF